MSQGYILATDQNTIANGISVISITPSVSLRATGQTPLYVVPSGVTTAVTDFVICITSASSVLGLVIASAGSTTPFNQWATLSTLASLNTTGQILSMRECSIGQARMNFISGATINFNVGTAATSGTLVATIYTLGFLF